MPTSCDKALRACVCVQQRQIHSLDRADVLVIVFYFFAKCSLKCISCNVMCVEQWFVFANVESCSTLFLVCMISQILDLDFSSML